MPVGWWLAAVLAVPLQVPAPTSGAGLARELDAARRAILGREETALGGLAEQLAQKGDAQGAQAVRSHISRHVAPDGAARFVPLPEIVPPRPAVEASAWAGQLGEIRSRAATELFVLAKRAAETPPPHFALASECLHGVLDRQPDHREARRLLGYVPHEGGWAKPFAVQHIRRGNVNHPVFGWVGADWVPHLDRGELPSPPVRGQQRVRWLSVAEADRLRANWDPPWQIFTEHFEIQTNVPLAQAISFGRRLEAFHDLFMAILADILGENLPLARRYRDSKLTGEPASKPHLVYYFSSKDEYVAHLSPRYGSEIERSLGFYPTKAGRGGRAPAYFFRDPGGQLPETANLYHEVSHQLLFETAGPNAYTKNAGNYWVFEGLGTYFETVEPQPDGSLEVGGLVGRRMEEAIKALVLERQGIPLAEFIAKDEASFTRHDSGIYLRYQQAMALAVFLMHWHDGVYREGFLDYVRDAYRGRIKRGNGRSLNDRLGQPFATLDAQLVSFLRRGIALGQKPEAERANRPTGGSIRTVPRP
jgi:hypothetical protein